MNAQTNLRAVIAAAATIWMVTLGTQLPAAPSARSHTQGQPQGGQTQQPQQQPPQQQAPQQPTEREKQEQQKQQQKPAAPQAQEQEEPRPAIPAAASSIAERPERFYGEFVTVYATVERSLTPTAFVIDQDKTKTTGKEVIVLARRLHKPVEPNTYVTVMGEVLHPDSAEIAKVAKEAAAGLPPEVLAQNAGKPVIFATTVLTPDLEDLARFIPPPMTPDEQMLDKAMKSIGPANGALRKAIQASNLELLQKNLAVLAPAFADTETFWKKRGNAEAIKLAQTARSAVAAIGKAADMGNWNEIKAQSETLGQQCTACHKQFRVRLEDGSFAVRKDGR